MAAFICKKAIVKGLVQGVGFRHNTARQAHHIGNLRGYVRNLANGDVEILVQGRPEEVAALLDWARKGPPAARVTELVESAAPVDPELPVFEQRR